jgi:putative nucleotidyltransferase with HDIG domain
MIPTIDMCKELMDRFNMPEHIRRHSEMVESAALLIVDAHLKAGTQLSREKVRAGALLHDIAKALCLKNGGDHALKGGEICKRNNFQEITEIVAEHVRLRDYSPKKQISEKEIVYYADKRVNHDKIVSLDERLLDLIKRYGKGRQDISERIRLNFELCRDVEKKIFKELDFGPADLPRLLE